MTFRSNFQTSGFRQLEPQELEAVSGGDSAGPAGNLASRIYELLTNRCIIGSLGDNCREAAVNSAVQELITDREQHSQTSQDNVIYFNDRGIYAEDRDRDGRYDHVWDYSEGNGWRINDGSGWQNTLSDPFPTHNQLPGMFDFYDGLRQP